MSAAILYGIKSCDKVRDARKWLDAHGVAHRFHDTRADGVTRELLEGFARGAGWEGVLNRMSVSFRALPEVDKAGLDEGRAIRLMLAEPTMIKRPILALDARLVVGFKPELYQAAFCA